MTRQIADIRSFRTRYSIFRDEIYITPPVKTFDDVRDDHRLRKVLRRAVKRDKASQWLVETIRQKVRG